MKYYTLSIVTPTYNSMRTMEQCLRAVMEQDYPHSRMEFLIADGGSTDGTVEYLERIAQESDFPIRIYKNSLKTAEAGKAVAVREAKNEVVLLLDSDNIIPEKGWITRMMRPFGDGKIVASEPIHYTYRRGDSTINRYCALIGMNDPLCLFTGNYDRFCCLTGKWTEVEREEEDCGDYLSIRFHTDMIPTIGANGFFMRRRELVENFDGNYLFDIDVLWELFRKQSDLRVAKVKTGIVHLFCPDIKTFYRKQNRRITDFLYFSEGKGRKYPWNRVGKERVLSFLFACLTVFPLIVQSVKGYRYKKDLRVWIYHPILCWVTLWVYGMGTLRSLFHKEAADRSGWKQ